MLARFSSFLAVAACLVATAAPHVAAATSSAYDPAALAVDLLAGHGKQFPQGTTFDAVEPNSLGDGRLANTSKTEAGFVVKYDLLQVSRAMRLAGLDPLDADQLVAVLAFIFEHELEVHVSFGPLKYCPHLASFAEDLGRICLDVIAAESGATAEAMCEFWNWRAGQLSDVIDKAYGVGGKCHYVVAAGGGKPTVPAVCEACE